MSGEYCGVDTSNEVNSEERSDERLYCGDAEGNKDPGGENVKLHEMGEALEIAENRCNTLKEQLDQMRHLYRERSNLERSNSKEFANGVERRTMEMKQAIKQPILRQNSDSISTDNSGAAVLTINNILNGITNSINRLSELHSYMETDTRPFSARKKSKQTKAQENEFASENRNSRFVDRRSSSWLFNEKKKEQKKRAKRTKPAFESGSLTQIRKPGTRGKLAPREEQSTTSVKGRKRFKRLPKTTKKTSARRPGFNNNLSSNHLVEIYHNAAVDYADSDELINRERVHSAELRNFTRSSHADIKSKYNRKDIQMPTVSTTECKEEETYAQPSNRIEGMRSLSPIKEQDVNVESTPSQNFQPQYIYQRYQSPTISSKMKQVARGYFRHFTCKSIPFCAAKSTSPSHNIGINIQQVMSIIKGRQSVNGISPTLAHNIGLAAERLNNESLSAMVSNFGSRYGMQYPQMPCPMQCNMNYQQLQEMATEVPNEEVQDEDANNESEKDKVEIEVYDKRSSEVVSWSIDPDSHNNCTCVKQPGVGFNQVIDKYQNYASPRMLAPTGDNLQQNMYAQRIQKQTIKKYRNIRSVYAQYNEASRKSKKESLGELSTDGANMNTNLPLHGKEKILKGVLINLHEEFASLSDKYDELIKIVEDEKQSNPDNVEKLETLEKKLNEKEVEIQMVMALYTEVVTLKQQVRALKEKAGVSTAILDHQKQQFKMCQRLNQQQQQQQQQQQSQQAYSNIACQQGYPPQLMYSRQRESKTNAAIHLTKLLRQIQAYQEVYKTGGK